MFREYNQEQDFLLPPSFKEYLWEWHEVIILSELIDELYLWNLINEYNKNINWNWRPAYHPKMLLKVLIYWYMNNTFPSRKLAKKLKSDLAFMYISGNNKPDFRTINRFRKEKWDFLEEIFTQIVFKAKDLWLISFWTLSLDWTKIYANASKNNNYDLKWLEKTIKWFFDKADKIDELEDKEFWEDNGNHIPEELKTKKWREKKKKELEEKRKKIELKKEIVKQEIENKKESWINQNKINLTDKDSRLMQMKKMNWSNWYNPQNITENRFIISTRVPNTTNDKQELIASLEKLEKKYWVLPKNILADKWYWTENNYLYWKEKNIITYIPHSEQKWVNLKQYKYNRENDTYEDDEWNIYKFKQYFKSLKWNINWRPKKWEITKEEDFKGKRYVTTLKNWRKKVIQFSKNTKNIFKENDDRLYSEKWKEIYKKRSWDVENVFWNIKYNLKFERFNLRWFKGVQIEWNLIGLAHNLQKLIKCRAS